MGWAVQIEQPAAAARWVSSLGMQQLMAAWVLGGKMGFSRVGMGSSDMAWAAVSSRRDGSLTFFVSLLPLPFFSFFSFFPLFLAFPFGFGVLLTAGFSSSSSSFLLFIIFYFLLFFIIFIFKKNFLIYIYILRFSWALKTHGLAEWDRDG